MNSHRMLLIVALTSLAACGGRSTPAGTAPSPDPGALRACDGGQNVQVSNDWTGAVDIVAQVGDEGRPRGLGTVQAGQRADFGVPEGARDVYALQAGRDEPNALTMGMRRYVRMRFTCR